MTITPTAVSRPRPAVPFADGMLGWWHAGTPEARRALVAASVGWMLNMGDMMLYAMVLAPMILDLGMTKATGGLLSSLTLAMSAGGGVVFGLYADRHGRTRALIVSTIIYSVFTGATGLAQTVVQVAIVRILLGIGMGGVWASGAALVSETWPAEHRGKALGLMQSAAALGKAVAAVITALVLPLWGWRAVFYVGVLPILFTIWVGRRVAEPEVWRRSRAADPASRGRFADILRGGLLPLTVSVTLMNAFTMFGWWALNLWVPAYLLLPASEGGIGLSPVVVSALMVVMQAGQWLGYVTFGFVCDAFGRKPTYIGYLIAAALSVVAYVATRDWIVLLLLGPVVSFFGAGHFSGFGVVTAEIYPTSIRATAQGFTYNVGRIASALAPFAVGSLAESHGFRVALGISAVTYVLAASTWAWIPETKGRTID